MENCCKCSNGTKVAIGKMHTPENTLKVAPVMDTSYFNMYGHSLDATKTPVTLVTSRKKSAFPGMFNEVKGGMYITRVLYNDPVTVVFWSDGSKTMSRKHEGDTYNKEFGLSLCILKKLTSGDQVARLLDSWVVEGNDVDLKDLREADKAEQKAKKAKAKKN